MGQKIKITHTRSRRKRTREGARLTYFAYNRMYHVEQGGMIDPDALIRILIEEGRGRGEYGVIEHKTRVGDRPWITFGPTGQEPRP